MANRDDLGFRAPAGEDGRWRAYEAAIRRKNGDAPTRPLEEPRPADPVFVDRPKKGGLPGIVVLGGVAAIAAAVVFAAPGLYRRVAPGSPSPAPATGLRVSRTVERSTDVTPRQALPCYVNGVSAGTLPLVDCAARNGVATGPLDVGLDRRGLAPGGAPVLAGQVRASIQQPPGGAVPAGRPVFAQAFSPMLAPPSLPAQRSTAAQAAPPAFAGPRPTLFRDARRYADAPRAYASPAPWRPHRNDEDNAVDEARPMARGSLMAAREFYDALGDADGDRAASLVVPEKRRQGPLSAGAISRFYGSLRAPLRITHIYPRDDDTVSVGYQFLDREGELCSGEADVKTTLRDGVVLVRGVRALRGC